MKKLRKEWFPLFFYNEINNKPISKTLLGIRLVFIKMKNEIFCFEDRCPHRNVPLSNGTITNDELRCNYHGWSFNSNGNLENIPACKCNYNVKLKKYYVEVADNIVWVKLSGDKVFFNHFNMNKTFSNLKRYKNLKADFIHSIENFLDPTHTPYIHKGLLRSKGKQRMNITQQITADGFITYYDLIDKQNGVINKLFDKGITRNIASFQYPGFAKIEYIKNEKVIFIVSIFFIPVVDDEVKMLVSVDVARSLIPSFIKFLFLKPFLELAFYQDKKILESQYYKNSFLKKTYIVTKTDIVIDHLFHLFDDKDKGIEKDIYIEL